MLNLSRVFVWLTIFVAVNCDIECTDRQRSACLKQENNCDACIQAHPCCTFSYYKAYDQVRCDLKSYLSANGSPDKYIEDSGGITSFKVLEEKDFRDYTKSNDAVQLRPQHFVVNLRPKENIRINFQYKPARNYPLDLYYLTDASGTMSTDFDTLISLTKDLAANMMRLTENFRLALGIFSEKNLTPYSYVPEEEMLGMCEKKKLDVCAGGYDFIHKLNFTEDASAFVKQIISIKNQTTINIDGPEAGLDAIMQVMLCNKRLEWADTSRKMIVMATDAPLHLAGEGILGGATKRNTANCSLDDDGNYMKSVVYDYPSIEDIDRQLLRSKMNLLFAAKDDVYDYYKDVAGLMPEVANTAKLEQNATNVIELVQSAYTNVIKNVRFSLNETIPEELDVTFEATCNKARIKEEMSCGNIIEGNTYNFQIVIGLKENPGNITGRTIYIEEQNIKEKIRIDLNYIGHKCTCNNLIDSNNNCKHGEYRCGSCYCYEGWTGSNCDELCDETNNWDLCRQTNGTTKSLTCHGQGDCVCGKCECLLGRGGKYCEYTCPVKRGKVCSGHGKCVEGGCSCHPDYSDKFCSCLMSDQPCIAPGQTEVCSGHGNCKCGECKCTGDRSGIYCERCPACSGLCGLYAECTEEYMLGENNASESCKNLTIDKDKVIAGQEECRMFYRKDKLSCDTTYKYIIEADKKVVIGSISEKCTKPLSATTLAGTVIVATVALGILGIIIFKVVQYRKDKAEFAQFQTQLQKRRDTDNPLYASPVREYKNPLREKQDEAPF